MNEMKFVRRVSLLTLITFAVLAGATARPGYSSTSDTATMTVGQKNIFCGTAYNFASGYLYSTFGSYSPTGLTGGTTVFRLFEYAGSSCGFPAEAIFGVTNFSANPGQSWLVSVTCNGVTRYGSAAGYSYSGGEADWDWGTSFGFFGHAGQAWSCTIVHN